MAKRINFLQRTTSRRTPVVFLVLVGLIVIVGIGLAKPDDGILSGNSKTSNQLAPTATPSESKLVEMPEKWNDYREPDYGFVISYPDNWIVEDGTNRIADKDPLKVLLFRPLSIPTRLMKINDVKLREKSSVVAVLIIFPEPMNSVVEKISSYSMSNVSKKDAIIGDLPGIKIEGESIVWDEINKQSTTQHSVVYVFPYGDNSLTFTFHPTPINTGFDYSELLPFFLQSILIR